MKKEPIKNVIISFLLVIIFIIFTIITYYNKQDHSFASLNAAVEKQSNGGEIDEVFEYKEGMFVFIKQSSKKKNGYYYEKNHRWYSKPMLSNHYKIDDYEVETYYVKKDGYYFVKVESGKEIMKIHDSLYTDFKEMIIQGKKVYIGGTERDLTSSYTLTINDKDNIINYYQKIKKILQ